MTSRHPTLEKIARALEFANVDSIGEMEALLAKHAEAQNPSAANGSLRSRPAEAGPVTGARIFKLTGSRC